MKIDYTVEEKLRIARRMLLWFIPLGIGITAFTGWRTVALVRAGEKATGIVVSLVSENAGNDRGTVFAPKVRFTTHTGRTVEFVSPLRSAPARFSVGQRVPVVYSRDNPSHARIDRFVDLWLLPLVFGVSTVGNLALYWVLGILGKRLKGKKTPAAGEW